ncbi:MAG TPA: DEAD/DEAH box helicase [Paenalcaligenes sp.]|nr:DEAD/DEAH box helicase [Paenalcaligenes sp.]
MTSTENSSQTPTEEKFSDFGLHPDLLKAIDGLGYEHPTPIQASAIPVALQGRDVMGAAQTGTGKTAAFVLPILHRLMPLANHSMSPARHPVRALILTPTRELADQVYQSVKQYSQHTPLRSTVVFGGVDMNSQTEALRQGCEVLVATPGRLLDHIEQRHVSLAQVGVLVLDEADRMLDMGFLPDLSRIVRTLPAQRQGLLFSATFSREIRRLSRDFLNHPVEIEVAHRNTTADTVTQGLYKVRGRDKQAALVQLLKEKSWSQTIIFTNTRAGAERVARYLARHQLAAEAIHGDKSQNERLRILDSFKKEQTPILVATDVAARGLDIAGVSAVVNFELPFNAEDYVHRIGRTGRAGASGEAYSLYDEQQEQRLLEEIQKLIGEQITPQAPLAIDVRAHDDEPRGQRGHRQPHRQREQGSRQGTSPQGGRRHRGRQEPEDPIFHQPYEPQRHSNAPRESSSHDAEKTRRRSVGVLLGGN